MLPSGHVPYLLWIAGANLFVTGNYAVSLSKFKRSSVTMWRRQRAPSRLLLAGWELTPNLRLESRPLSPSCRAFAFNFHDSRNTQCVRRKLLQRVGIQSAGCVSNSEKQKCIDGFRSPRRLTLRGSVTMTSGKLIVVVISESSLPTLRQRRGIGWGTPRPLFNCLSSRSARTGMSAPHKSYSHSSHKKAWMDHRQKCRSLAARRLVMTRITDASSAQASRVPSMTTSIV